MIFFEFFLKINFLQKFYLQNIFFLSSKIASKSPSTEAKKKGVRRKAIKSH